MLINKKIRGFTLLELIISIGIIGILAAFAAPIYTRYTSESKVRITEANMLNIKQAFVNHYYLSVMARQTEFPPAPADSIMDTEWAESNILYNGKTPASLFSEGRVPINAFGVEFKYALLPATSTEFQGFMIKDPTTGKVIEFRP